MSTSKRVRIFTAEDVANHISTSSCWVSRGGKVYDVSAFLPDHPGGDDLILKYAGKDIDSVMKDAQEHEHSESAYDMMAEYVIGRLGCEANIVDESELRSYITRCIVIDWATTKTGRLPMTSILTIRTQRRILRSISSWTSASLCCCSSGSPISGWYRPFYPASC